ncbi:MAG: Uma2 family endonuclease [Jaaginema sp. PMC 1079.18]|nr:Uma2 family endonuclease [Jaaginema sp. PMC 1080.18]MEC4850005.1 Uma2 family endonuclease [Jaaginema sp. PMC 1079.18]MEC4865928.1 Uma2 family endonuclease [Jaaginema sp. PMC 1078.18]
MIAVPHHIKPSEYLIIDRDNPIRHEYRQGLVYVRAGGSDAHARIAVNLLTLINPHLGGTSCRLYNGDVKVNYEEDFYYYPDAFVTCDESVPLRGSLRDRADRFVKRYPKFIAEVLSESTEAFDRGFKFSDYQKLDSLEEYVLISPDSQRVECRRRRADDTWETIVYEKGEIVNFASLELEFDIKQLYFDID